MRIAITGATGGLGRNLCLHYLSKGHDVTALGRNEHVGSLLRKAGAKFQSGDLLDTHYLRINLTGSDVVIHAAALASPWGLWQDFARTNIMGTSNVTQVAHQLNLKKFIYISTPSIYFSGRDHENITEAEIEPNPQGHYARSKLMAEQLVSAAVSHYQLPAVILRPRGIFGPYDQVILPRLIKQLQTGIFPLPNGGKARVDLTAVENVSHAVDLAIEANSSVHGRAYNITNNESMTVKDMVALLADTLGYKVKMLSLPLTPLLGLAHILETWAYTVSKKEPPLTRYGLGLLGRTQTLNISRAKHELSYKPIIDMSSAFKNFANWRNSH